ncbi:caspase family protein [Streptomyces halstedii]|uniref:caspase, EACC1-associated type n=1 Tax=Streptomyces halstedii TaxID=1944 RepID=UPI00380CAEF0
MRLPDPQRSYAVLIGTSTYHSDRLPDLPAVSNNLQDLCDVLTDPALGGLPADRCVVVSNPSDPRTLFRTLRKYAAAAEDTFLIYFASHGQIGPRNELYLGLAETVPDELKVSALAFDLLRDVLADCPAANRVVILDCCFSGNAIQDMAGEEETILGQLGIEGTYLLTSTPANTVALAPDGAAHTAFTGELLLLLRTGIPSGPEFLTYSEIYRQLLHTATTRGLPVPRQRGTGTVDLLGLVRNRHMHKLGGLPGWRALRVMSGHQGRVLSLDFSSDGKLLASSGGAKDLSVRLWDTKFPHHANEMTGHKKRVHSVKFSPEGTKIASCGDDGQLFLWDLMTRRLAKSYDGQGFPLNALAFSPDGSTIAAASDEGTVKLWNLTKGTQHMVLRGHIAPVRAIDFSPTGRLIASTGDDSTVRIWEVASGVLVQQFSEHTGKVFGVRFSPDGQTLATCGIDKTVRLWDVESGACKETLLGHADSARCVAFSPDGKLIASGGDDGTIRLWDVRSTVAVSTLHGHGGFPTRWVMWVEFHPDGNLLASCGHDRTIRLWRRVPVEAG